ncbi:MAG: hypothetical protein H0V70_11815 [Ktedonobacteraceae bacterium]|nr:hypothetical protein [Ktedonobacteraceae bacterium]
MDLPSQPPSSEEPKQQHIHSSEEAPIQPSPDADSLTEETQPQNVNPITEEAPTESAPVADSLPEESQPQSVNPVIEDVPTESAPVADSLPEEIQPLHADPIVEDVPGQSAATSEPLADETEPQITSLDQDEEEDEDLEVEEETRSGVFIGRGLLIAIACGVVIVALMATLLVVVTRPKDPPTDWIASYTPPATAGTPAGGKILYYLHWTNQNGSLKGQLQLETVSNGALQSATAATIGLYSKDNHVIYVVITLNGQASTLAGTINDNNDTLTLDSPGATTPGGGLIFHTGSANDYKLAAKNLGAKK